MAGDLPRVTVAFPLYRSGRFVENIAGNIDRLRYPNVEILISDRHLLDDALDVLARRYAADTRVRIVRQPDGADWVTHYNDLLRTAVGAYFCWMPHDDVFADGYIEALAERLTANRDAVIAFGAMDSEDCGRGPAVTRFTPPPIAHRDRWSPMETVHLHLHWELMCLMRGLMRRDHVIRAGLLLPRTHQLVFADVCWVFAVALSGCVLFVPAARCVKRYVAASASADWRFGVRQAFSEWWTMSRALWRSTHPRRAVLPAMAVIAYVAAVRIGWRAVRRVVGRRGRAPGRVRSTVLRPVRSAVDRQDRPRG